MRNGTYHDAAGTEVSQSMYFQVGDVLQADCEVKEGKELSTKERKAWKAVADHQCGEIVSASSELVGVIKGIRQVLRERGVSFSREACCRTKYRKVHNDARAEAKALWKSEKVNYYYLLALLQLPTSNEVGLVADALPCRCARCTLSAQPDFASQLSGLEEVYKLHNDRHGTNHQCIFLPKFHPELNCIERCWSRMKNHVRTVNDGTADNLQKAMIYGLSQDHLSLCTIRKYCRLITCYYEAYAMGHDIVTAEAWIKKHRTHRGYAKEMDAKLESIYFPLGRPTESSSVETRSENEVPTEEELAHIENLVDELFPTLDIVE